MVFARSVFSTEVIKFELKPHSFFLAFCQFFSQSMHLFEQFFEALFIIFVFINVNLNILIAACWLSSYSL